MAKDKIQYQCHQCGSLSPKWVGQCPDCHAWNSLQEVVISTDTRKVRSTTTVSHTQHLAGSSDIINLNDVDSEDINRIGSGIAELDRAMGGGIVAGSVILIGGDPGIGKSTLLLQMSAALSQQNQDTLYVTAEESQQQVALRARRLNLKVHKVRILTQNHLQHILSSATQEQARILIIDSIQTVYTDELPSAPGAVAQVRECTAQLVRLAKHNNITVFLVGHVTKEGALAGPRVLEHMVDTVLYFEGDSSSRYRMVRSIKNRFGAVNELGVFAMTDTGLKQVSNPSAIFLSRHEQEISGSMVMVSQEGTRPMLLEIQALVDTSYAHQPKRLSVGLDHNRLAMLMAVMHRHCGIAIHDQDVFLNAVGGVRITETASDLAVALALFSSLKNKPLSQSLIAFGEVGLAGEVRPIQNGIARLNEAAKHGFNQAIIPKANTPRKQIEGIHIKAVSQLSEALDYVKSL